MTREEFSKELKDARISRGVTRIALWQRSGLTEMQIQRMEKGGNNYGLKNVIRFLQSLVCDLVLLCDGQSFVVDDSVAFVSFFRNRRTAKSISRLKLSELSKISNRSLEKLEQGVHISRIDAFLAIASALDVEIKICPIEK